MTVVVLSSMLGVVSVNSVVVELVPSFSVGISFDLGKNDAHREDVNEPNNIITPAKTTDPRLMLTNDICSGNIDSIK